MKEKPQNVRQCEKILKNYQKRKRRRRRSIIISNNKFKKTKFINNSLQSIQKSTTVSG